MYAFGDQIASLSIHRINDHRPPGTYEVSLPTVGTREKFHAVLIAGLVFRSQTLYRQSI